MRKITNINAGWLFTKTEKPAQILEGEKLSKTNHHNDIKIADDGSGAWETVNLPHTWNGQDGHLGVMDYYKMENVLADTRMRASIAEPNVKGKTE